MKKNKITVFNVTNNCSQNCEFCFGPKPDDKKDISTKAAKKKIETCYNQGSQKIVFTGGEPLLRLDIIELIKYANEKGLYTILHTNGELVTYSFLEEVDQYLDQINLPLDGYNEKTNVKVRTRGHYAKIISILQILKNKNIKIIISTVAFKKNIKKIKKIGKILPDWIYKWRVFQVRDVDDELMVSDKKFQNLDLGKHKFKVQKVGRRDREFDGTYEVVNDQ